jgi:circadian clock protein KaiC
VNDSNTADGENGAEARPGRLSTGVSGLDDVLRGGLIPQRSYLVRGRPGTGKTILGLHFLTQGTARGETSLFINLEETTADIAQNAATLGIDVEGIEFLDLSPESEFFAGDRGYDIFEPSEVERDPIVAEITDRVSALDPDRVFVDPLSQLRHLSSDQYQFRKQTLSFMRLLGEHGATVLFTTQATDDDPDDDLQYMSDGTIELGHGPTGRSLAVSKFRGSDTVSGDHAVRITGDGLVVYPELSPGEYEQPFAEEAIPSGVPEMDELLDGGLDRGTVSVISGPTGVGKTTMGTQFMKEAAGRGERSVIYLFEESENTFLQRSKAVDIPVEEMRERGTLSVEVIEALDTSPQEFAHMVRREVEQQGAEIVMIDGISGYKLALKGSEDDLVRRLHSLGRYLRNMGVTVLMIEELSTVTGDFQATDVGISYLADNILFLRHLELHGELRKIVGVLKMRTSDFERTLREFEITEHGITVGEPLTGLRGILSGTPDWTDHDASGNSE